jgi:hypothetical protein
MLPGMEHQADNANRRRNLRALRAAGKLAWVRDEVRVAWRAAHDDAADAYRTWRDAPGPVTYAAYRAAQDRADAAQDTLAEHHR